MNRSLLVLMAGIVAGAVAHVGWFSARQRQSGDDLGAQLGWMQQSLGLSPEQFARVKALHEESSPRLVTLAAEVARMRDEFAAFERERQTTGKVDFLEFARFVEQRRAIDRECAESTRRLILATTGVMSPEQRERYRLLLNPVSGTSGANAPN